jgi:hypothetical protein
MSELSTLMTMDLELNNLDQFNPGLTHVLGGNTFTTEASAAHHGNYGIQIYFAGTNYNCQRWVNPWSEQSGMYIRYYFKFSTDFTNSEAAVRTLNVGEFRHDTGNTVMNQRWNISAASVITMGQLNYYDDAGNHFVTSGSMTITKGTWYRFEKHYKKATGAGANDGECEVRVYANEADGGGLITSKKITGLDSDAMSLTNFAIGNLQGNCIPTSGSYILVDSVVCNDEVGGWPGPYDPNNLYGYGLSESVGVGALNLYGYLYGYGLSESLGVGAITGIEALAGYGSSESSGVAAITGILQLAGYGLSESSGVASIEKLARVLNQTPGFISSMFGTEDSIEAKFYRKIKTFVNGKVTYTYLIDPDATINCLFWTGSSADSIVSERYRVDVQAVLVMDYNTYIQDITEESKVMIDGKDYSVIYIENIGNQNQVIQIPLKRF